MTCRTVFLSGIFCAVLLSPLAARAMDFNAAVTMGGGYGGSLRNPSKAPDDVFAGELFFYRLDIGTRFLDRYRAELTAGLQGGPGFLAAALLWVGLDGAPTFEGEYLELRPTVLAGLGAGGFGASYHPTNLEDGYGSDFDVDIDSKSIISALSARYELLAFKHAFVRLGVTYRVFWAFAQDARGERDPSFQPPGIMHDVATMLSVGAQF